MSSRKTVIQILTNHTVQSITISTMMKEMMDPFLRTENIKAKKNHQKHELSSLKKTVICQAGRMLKANAIRGVKTLVKKAKR